MQGAAKHGVNHLSSAINTISPACTEQLACPRSCQSQNLNGLCLPPANREVHFLAHHFSFTRVF